MHRHESRESAARCSRYCLQATADRLYYERHGHMPEYPRDGCGPCEDDAKRAETQRKAMSYVGR